MRWLERVPNAEHLVAECIESERIRYSNHFNALLGRYILSRLRLLRQLNRSKRRARYDYIKGRGEIPCFCLVASKTPDEEALTFFVSFELEPDGPVQLWIQEFHP